MPIRPAAAQTLALTLTLALALAMPIAAAAAPRDCHVGVYRLTDRGVVDIAPSVGETLRWRRFDGTTGALTQAGDGAWTSTFGWTGRADGRKVEFGSCASGAIQFAGVNGQRITLDITDATFQGRGGVSLAGRLLLPAGSGPVPIVVLVHGSEDDSARDSYFLQRLLPAQGVGVFVYDKRGTGGSGGHYTQDFDVLADDAVAAMREARQLAGFRAGRVGYQGGSEGGWVAPMAAARAPVDFLIVGYGLAVSVIDEDQEEAALEMRLKGDSPAQIAKALEVASAAEKVFASGFTRGFERFDALRAKYRSEPWYKDLHGNFTWMLLPNDDAALRKMATTYAWHTPFYYDPMPTLRRLGTPQLWILGEDDLEAPSAETSRRLKGLMDQGRPITLALFPGAEHGITEYESQADGERVSTRYSDGYFAMMRDFATTGGLQGRYGASAITRASAPSDRPHF
jgi:alpha-beta hydrolase superfamily lysophospholipase